MGIEFLPSALVDETTSTMGRGDDYSELPHRDCVQKWWDVDERKQHGTNNDDDFNNDNKSDASLPSETRSGHEDEDILVEARGLTVRKGDATLLKNCLGPFEKGSAGLLVVEMVRENPR